MANTQRLLALNCSSPTASTGVGDTGKMLSQINHRMYRQGRNYCIRISMEATNVTRSYRIFALRDDWMLHNAWKLAFQTFMNNSKEEMEVLSKSGGKARWQDFRVNPGVSGGGVGNMQPVEYTLSTGTPVVAAFTAGEFPLSEVHTEGGTQYDFSWGPSAAGTYSILEEYDRVGNTTNNPTTPLTSAAYAGLDGDTQSGQLEHLSDGGNEPPYNQTSISHTTPWVKIATIGSGANGSQQLNTGYFNAPCGLFVVVASGGDLSAVDLYLEAKPGDYKDVHAPAMGTAKLVKNHYEVR